MTRTGIFQDEILDVLKQLERCCDRYALYNKKNSKTIKADIVIDIMITDIVLTHSFKDIMSIYDVATFLQDEGLDFRVVFDFVNDSPLTSIDEKHPSYDFLLLGTVRGKSIQKIKTKIEELIVKVDSSLKGVAVPATEPILVINPDDEEQRKIKISKLVYKKYKDIKLKIKDGKGYLQLTKGGKKICVGKITTRTYKMVKYLLEPASKTRKVIEIFELISLPKDNKDKELEKDTTRSYSKKKEIIAGVIDQLQKRAYLSGCIAIDKFDDIKKTVFIKLK